MERLPNGPFFKTQSNEYFRIDCIAEFNCIVLEYGESKKAAGLGQLEDGDCFYLNELSDEELLRAVMAEISKG